MPTETFSHTSTAIAGVGTVWAAVDMPETWGSISGIDSVRDPVFSDGKLTGFSFNTAVAGQHYVGIAESLERVERERIGWAIANSEIRGSVRVDLVETADGTQVTVTLEVTSVGMMSRMFFPVIANTLGAGLPKTVEDFAAGFGPQS